jgi:hypothetical protein
MKVWELLALVPQLEEADSEDTVVINAGSNSVLLLNTRPGLFPPLEDPADLRLTEDDENFLRALHIPS